MIASLLAKAGMARRAAGVASGAAVSNRVRYSVVGTVCDDEALGRVFIGHIHAQSVAKVAPQQHIVVELTRRQHHAGGFFMDGANV
jgi:hypothetical protein